jgi:hypothetical protein
MLGYQLLDSFLVEERKENFIQAWISLLVVQEIDQLVSG